MVKENEKVQVTKINQIQDYLIKNGEISSWDAFEKFGATRLASTINQLKKRRNMNIQTVRCSTKDRNGQTCNYAVYKYLGDNNG